MILAAADEAVSAGLTGVHEMGIDDETIAVYRKLAAEGRLKLRVYAFLTGEGQIASLSRRKPDVDENGTAAFTLRSVKLYADGSLGSRSAALLAPYADDPGNSGLSLTTPEALAEAVLAASASGFQLGIHAIGDRANRMVLDAYAKVAGKDQRHRIEHAQIVAPEDLGRFAALGVVAAMQPTLATSDMPWAEARLGKDRLAGAYAWKSIMAAGAHVVGGSDFPIEEVSPLLGLDAALTRQDAQGNPPGGWLPKERLTLEEALRIYTVEPAWSSFQERNHGRIARGMVADLTVLDGDLSAGRLLSRKVDWTIVGGQIVHARTAEGGG
jgi:predicted amidohydrolase YtcJ